MEDVIIRDTVTAIDRALASIAIRVAGTAAQAQELLLAVSLGERSQIASMFLTEAAALMRARILLADAVRPEPQVLRRAVA